MRKYLIIAGLNISFFFCQDAHAQFLKKANNSFTNLLEQYYNERMQLLPIEATYNGEPNHNGELYADFTDSYRSKLRNFFSRYRVQIQNFKRNALSKSDRISYDILKREMDVTLEGLAIGYFGNIALNPDYKYFPFHQFSSIPLYIGTLGSGESGQPFKTVKDYNDWQKRVVAFSVWADSAIVYFRKGIAANVVLPEALVVKMIPQMESMVVTDPTTSLFYGPINKLPDSFSAEEKKKLTTDYLKLITDQLVPTYKKLANFLKTEYLPKSRKTAGIGALPGGDQQYKWLIRNWTTTDKTPDEIFTTGKSEVKRIRSLMDSIRQTVGFRGDLKQFFAYMKTDKQFMPFKTPEDVLNVYRAVEARIEPNLKKLFNHVPKTKFEVRQTEAFRAASAAAEYAPGLANGSRPGIFYVPILDATTFNVTTGMEALFLHEAIPGHHYQFSLQTENEQLPKFRRYAWYGAYGEGWGLYAESLGKELGLLTDPYQYMGALGKEIHRSIRLVVDAGMHAKNWTRIQAIEYMMENEPLSEKGTISEIERYMAIPGQALSYKIGALKIQELRKKYEEQLGNRFSLAAFHDEILADGGMPLQILEKKMDAWALSQNQ
jgi:uncharacterized protein (DUF885 family)